MINNKLQTLLLLMGLSSSLLLGKTLVTVNGHKITDSIIPPGYEQLNKTKYNNLIQVLAKKEVLFSDLLKSPIVNSPEFTKVFNHEKDLAEQTYKTNTGKTLNQEQIHNIKGNIAVALYQEKLFKSIVVNETEIKDFYNNNQDKFNFPDAMHLANMLFSDKNQADAALATLKTSNNIQNTFKELSQQYKIQ